ncbi:hypothetical protein [Oligoflexus tunisiensis]|uniref:hypothetical protein n=1 Tax=Oligoflexus tunisiensis TaxID=708132 RepID=UPI001C405E63|nr:hypothetical protein [Oligoflexus tunisiensis]
MDIVREDGTSDHAELETRSFLLHDLIHYAVETELQIHDGFWGTLAAGAPLTPLKDGSMAPPLTDGAMRAERIVSPLQSLWNGRISEEHYLSIMEGMPDVDAGFVKRVMNRLRSLWGHWRATPYRASMDLAWPARSTDTP